MPVNLLNEKDLNDYLFKIIYKDDKEFGLDITDFKEINPNYLNQNKDAFTKALVYQWMKHRLRSHFMESEEKPFLKPVTYDESLPKWTKNVMESGQQVHSFDASLISEGFKQDVEKVSKFLYSRGEDYLDKIYKKANQTDEKNNVRVRIDYLKTSNEYDSFDKTLHMANKWEQLLEEKNKDLRKNKDFLKKSNDGVVHEFDLSEGMTCVRLLTSEALRFEGGYMGHCLSKDEWDKHVLRGQIEMYSLRDRNGKSHVTIDVRQGKVYQCRGREDKAPAIKYNKYVKEFCETKKLDVDSPEMRIVGVVKGEDGKYHDLFNIDENVKITLPELNISDRGLKKLPNLKNVTVTGHFKCNDNNIKNFENAPYVLGDIDISYNNADSLKGIQSEVFGNFICSNNNLKTLEGGPLKVKGGYSCKENPIKDLKGIAKEIAGVDGINCVKCRDLEDISDAPSGVKISYEGTPVYALNNKKKNLFKGFALKMAGKFRK